MLRSTRLALACGLAVFLIPDAAYAAGLPAGREGVPYHATTPVPQGTLPTGLTWQAGALAGTPTTSGVFDLTVDGAPDNLLVVNPTQRVLSFAGHTWRVPGFQQADPYTHVLTTYLPLWYVNKMLDVFSIAGSWHDPLWAWSTSLGTSPVVTLTGHGPTTIAVNGMTWESLPSEVRTDPYSHVKTTYVAIWYVMQVLKNLNVTSTWDGTTWTLTTPKVLNVGSAGPGVVTAPINLPVGQLPEVPWAALLPLSGLATLVGLRRVWPKAVK